MQEKQYNPPTAYRNIPTPSTILPPPTHFHLYPSPPSENQNAYRPLPTPHGYNSYPANAVQYLSHISPYQTETPLFPTNPQGSGNDSLAKPPHALYQYPKQEHESFQKEDEVTRIREKVAQQGGIPNFSQKQHEDSQRFPTNLTYRQAPNIRIDEHQGQDELAQEEQQRSNLVRIMPQNSYEMSSSRKFSLDSQYRKDSQQSYGGGGSKRKNGNRNKIKHKTNDSDRTAGRWKADEHDKFVQGLRKYGRDWKKVEQHIGSRTGAQIRSHAQKFFNKIAKQFDVNDPADFVISGEFQKRLNAGALSQSMQESTFLINNNIQSEDFLDASIHSQVSARNLPQPSSFFQKSHNNSIIQSKNNTPTKPSKKKKSLDSYDQDKTKKSQKNNRKHELTEQDSKDNLEMKQLAELIIEQPLQMDIIRARYENISLQRAQVASRIQDIPDNFIQNIIQNCNVLLENFITQNLENYPQNKELQIISQKLRQCLEQLQNIMQIRKNKDDNESTAPAIGQIKPQLAGAKSYFRNVILPSLGCRDTFQMSQKYPRVADWSMISFSSPQSSPDSDNKQKDSNNNNNNSNKLLELH